MSLAWAERRRHHRQETDAPGELILGQWPRRRRFSVRVRDMSESGSALMVPEGADLISQPAVLRWNGYRLSGTFLPRSSAPYAGFRFKHLLEEERALRRARPHRLVSEVLIVVLAGLIVTLKSRNIVSFWYNPRWQIYSMLAAGYVLSRVFCALFYRQPEDRGLIKPLSVVLPVKNEEAHIEEVVRRVFLARYPAEKIEVIVVDDGSTDKTWDILRKLALEYPRLQVERFERNRGKRHAMALGARKASGEILIYMDSDSMIDPEGFYRIIQPFDDPGVGAVAGHTDIIIEPDNLISKMEAVRYFVSERVMKASESIFGAVTCCPGPFSAYRRRAVLKILPQWVNQTFLGAPATFGDDRSLTARILRDYRVVYHAGARCATYAPANWRLFLKQQLRWKKSWIRETMRYLLHMWREHPLAALPYYASVLITFLSPLVVLRVFVYSSWTAGLSSCLPYLAGLMLVFLLLGVVYYYHTQSRYWYYGLVFAAVYSWLFSLQTYYAIATVRDNHWGTR